ncbi:L,D-transpeptidase family protein [Chelativorans multitrophicus]|uniref:L,D-TPase catalytic domain-containing protein n=2 Tax=Chelativorans TaxID=449972 RepID=Q11CT1_CHESB
MKARCDSLFNKSIIRQKRRKGTCTSRKAAQTSILAVRPHPRNRTRGLLSIDAFVFPCALGRSGISVFKREGDGATPGFVMHPLGIYFRRDRRRGGIGPARLPVLSIRSDLGWCDAPGDANYNRPVRLPFPKSHERMEREDALYDICVVLDWNIKSRQRGAGSAIFLHIAHPEMKPTEGCIAIAPQTMRRILPRLSRKTRIRVLS